MTEGYEKGVEASHADGVGTNQKGTDERTTMLLAPEEMTRLMLDNANDAIYVVQDHYIRFVNAKLTEITGYEAKELLTYHSMEFVHPEDRAVIYDRAQRRFRGELIPSLYPYRIVCKNGSVKWVEVNTVMITLQGRLTALSFMRDITEKKRAEEALEQSKRRLSDIIDFLPDATFAIDPKGHVVAWNRAIEDLTGIDSSNILGKGNYEYARVFYGQRKPILIDKVLDPTITVGERYVFYASAQDSLLAEIQMQENGRYVTFWCKAGLVYDQHGKVAGAIESMRDISALKAIEVELKAKSSSLEDMNTALKVLLNQREQDRKELEEKLVLNIKELVLPHIQKLKEENKDFTFAAHLNSVENNLKEIFSPFIMNLTSKYSNFTPREIQVAFLIRDGMGTKEIATALNLSTYTIETYRQSIRKKLGLKDKKGNIRSLLLSMQK